MADPGFAAQKAIYAALSGAVFYGVDSPRSVVPVYDRVPDAASYPYIAFDGQLSLSSGEPLASRRDERVMYLSVWSTYAGQYEVLDIMAQIDALLHNQRDLTMDTGRMMRVRVTDKFSQKDADGETYQGRVTLSLITEHSP